MHGQSQQARHLEDDHWHCLNQTSIARSMTVDKTPFVTGHSKLP